MKRVLKLVAAALAVLVLTAAVAYWGLGYRLQLDGSGQPRLARVQSPTSQASAVESHRAAQRTAVPEPPASTASAEPPPAASAEPATPSAGVPEPVVPATAEPPRPQQAAERTPYWVGFRGPLRDGQYREAPIRTAWPAGGLTPLWKQPIGGGYASFAIARGRAFTIEQRRSQEVVSA